MPRLTKSALCWNICFLKTTLKYLLRRRDGREPRAPHEHRAEDERAERLREKHDVGNEIISFDCMQVSRDCGQPAVIYIFQVL